MEQVQSREREFELHVVMAQPQITEVAGKLEAMMGEGAFRQLVIDEGTKAWTLYQRDISAQDAVNLVMQRFGKLANGNGMQAPVVPNYQTQSQQTIPNGNGRPPIIPNVTGKGTSPVKKVPKSIDDIKKVYQEKFGNG